MRVYKSRYGLLAGTTYEEVVHIARKEFQAVKRQTKRQPYVRSTYFNRDKVFLSVFWEHLAQKHRKDRMKRLKFYKAAIDLLRNTQETPDTIFSNQDKNTMLHRFYGTTSDGEAFCVQVKEDKRSDRKDFMSVFDVKQRK